VTLVKIGGSQGYWECPKNVIKEGIHKKLFCSFQNDDKNYSIVCLLQICGKNECFVSYAIKCKS